MSSLKYHGISQKAPRPIPEYAHTGTGTDNSWKRIGAQWSAVEPADSQYRVDPVVVRAIRSLDPDFVPLWLTTEHESPSGAVVRLVHHAIAWRLKTPHKKHQDRQILWPTTPGAINYGFGGYPVYVEEILHGEDAVPTAGFKALSWDDYDRIKFGIWWQKHEMPLTPEEEARREIQADEERRAKEEKRITDEVNYRFDHESKGVGRHLDQIGSADIKAWGAPKDERKPFVHVRTE